MHTDKKVNSFIWQIYGTLIGTTTLCLSRPESNGNKRVLIVSHLSGIEVSLSDAVQCHFPEHSLWRAYPSEEMQKCSRRILQLQSIGLSLFSVFLRTLKVGGGGLTPLQKCNWCILQLQQTGLRLFSVFLRTLKVGGGGLTPLQTGLRLFSVILLGQSFRAGESYFSAELQSKYSTAPAYWLGFQLIFRQFLWAISIILESF